MAWFYLLIAGLGEVGFVTFMKLSNNFKKLNYSILCVVSGWISFYLLSKALKVIPVGTGYTIWTGIGAAGSVIIGMMFFKESRDWKRLFFITLVIASVIGLKVISPH
ncbi:DMT family transporter [Gottfriedia solisilvae]|uniref:QacE family quaternary ammonium compound efflux SMR transporter n=1 Tax=Gottfriedia solisilvae TaxID=1516104 RepID=A0A8J3F120_9BACI|nr:multidrug efflux SMR transporter [Gottfriedia solisilvae]GGI18500.1 QacE family quaternary ammonium compound efflux SMR transporter [Gottfriedia solisilvae]